MATEMARQNIYIEPDTDQGLKNYAYLNNMSVSAASRMIFAFWLQLESSNAFKAAERLAEAKGVDTLTVITGALERQIPERYFKKRQ